MNKPFLFHYNTREEDERKDFHIRGVGVHEKMAPGTILHGDERYPWLFMYFYSPAYIRMASGTVKCDHTLMIWEPKQSHLYGNESAEWDHSWLIVKNPAIRRLLETAPLPLNTPVDIEAGGLFEKYLTLIHEELNLPSPAPFLLEHFIAMFLFELNRLLKKQYVPIPRNLQAIEQYMNQNLDQPLSIRDIAENFHISPPHLMARFKQYYGIAPMHYLTRKRMARAALLLQNYPYSCKEIAEKTGFGDPLYFSKRFRQYWGVSPREYRTQHRAGAKNSMDAADNPETANSSSDRRE